MVALSDSLQYTAAAGLVRLLPGEGIVGTGLLARLPSPLGNRRLGIGDASNGADDHDVGTDGVKLGDSLEQAERTKLASILEKQLGQPRVFHRDNDARTSNLRKPAEQVSNHGGCGWLALVCHLSGAPRAAEVAEFAGRDEHSVSRRIVLVAQEYQAPVLTRGLPRRRGRAQGRDP